MVFMTSTDKLQERAFCVIKWLRFSAPMQLKHSRTRSRISYNSGVNSIKILQVRFRSVAIV